MNHAKTRIIIRELIAKVTTSVGTPVIHKNDFEIIIRLLFNTLDTTLQLILNIVNRYNN